MSSSPLFSHPASRRIQLAALLLCGAVLAFAAYQHFLATPERQHIIRRYDEFRAVAATGNAAHMMEFVAPESRSWAADRLHLYQQFAIPIDNHSTVSKFGQTTTIRPVPQRYFYVIPGGHTIGMVKLNGEWFVSEVDID